MKATRKLCVALGILLELIVLPCIVAAQTGTIYNKDIHVVDYKDMQFPAMALTVRDEGIVVVQVKLDNQGKVTDAEALSGPSLLTYGSVENAKKWRFEPNPPKAAIIVYRFRIEGDCHVGPYGGAPSQMIFFPPNFAEITVCPVPPMTNTSGKPRRN